MSDNEILAEVKKAIDLFLDKTYEVKDIYSHILQIINDNSKTGQDHKVQLERLIFKLDELRENQRLFWGGHKSKLGICKAQEAELDKKIHYLLTAGGYSIERYKKTTTQNSLFNK